MGKQFTWLAGCVRKRNGTKRQQQQTHGVQTQTFGFASADRPPQAQLFSRATSNEKLKLYLGWQSFRSCRVPIASFFSCCSSKFRYPPSLPSYLTQPARSDSACVKPRLLTSTVKIERECQDLTSSSDRPCDSRIVDLAHGTLHMEILQDSTHTL